MGIDITDADQHLLILREPGSGRTEALRTLAHAFADRYGSEGLQMMVVDLRRNLGDLKSVGPGGSYVSRPPEIAAAMDELRTECVARINADSRDGEPIIVLVDDYDLIAGIGANPLAPLGEIIFQGRDTGIHVVLARTTTSAARLQTDPVIARMLEAGATALLLSGDRNEGLLVRGVRAQPLPSGRGSLLRRRGEPVLVQLALTDAVEPAVTSPAPQTAPASETAG